jgi:hypothetical protein
MNIRQEYQQTGEPLPAFDDAELRRLFDRIDRVTARIGEPDDLCFGSLCLKQILR